MKTISRRNAGAAAALAALGLLAGLAPSAQAKAKAGSAGAQAPAFTLNSQDGQPVSLHDFRGRWVVLYFYPKDFTSGCTIEAHNFQRDLAKYERRNAVILGVSVQSADSHKQFCVKEGLSFRLLADTKRSVAKAYGSLKNYGVTKLAARKTFLISPQGLIARAFDDVNPAVHSDEVLAALAELQAPKPEKKP